MSKVDAYIESVHADLQEIVRKVRKAVTESSKELKEQMKWNVPTYSINKNICAIMAHKTHVNLQVFQGAKIKDAKLLEGTGKGMRHLKYKRLSDVKSSVIKKVVKQAILIDS